MQVETMHNAGRLAELLTEALEIADAMGLPIAAIHIEEALSHISTAPPADVLDILPIDGRPTLSLR